MNLAEAKEKFYPEYKYALVDVKSNKPHSLYVDEKSRLNGIGQRFIDIAFNELDTNKPLITVSDNRISDFSRLLKKNNFEIVDSLSNYYSENHVEYTFNGHLYLPENVKYA